MARQNLVRTKTKERERERDRDRQTDRQTDRQREREREKGGGEGGGGGGGGVETVYSEWGGQTKEGRRADISTIDFLSQMMDSLQRSGSTPPHTGSGDFSMISHYWILHWDMG